MKLKFPLSVISVVLTVYLFSSQALAWPTIDPDIFKPKLPTITSWMLKCSTIEEAIDKKIERFDENKDKHAKTYDKLQARLSQKIGKWEARGFDVSDLKEDLEVLEEKIDKFSNDYEKFIDELRNTQNFTCGSSEGEFKNALQEAKNVLVDVRNDAKDIVNYYKNTIKPDLLELKSQIISTEDE